MSTFPTTDESFDNDIALSDTLVLVDFWAEWCGPCKQIGPILEEISNEKEDKFYKGAFYIKQITHQFDISDDTHTMNLLLAKDSLEEEILSSPENFEPESKVQPAIYNKIDDFYTSS